MISNERRSPYGHRLSSGHHQDRPRHQIPEETIRSEKVKIERKTFVFTLKENIRGRFLRITEDVNGRRDSIIIPATGLEDFSSIVAELVKVSGETPEVLP